MKVLSQLKLPPPLARLPLFLKIFRYLLSFRKFVFTSTEKLLLHWICGQRVKFPSARLPGTTRSLHSNLGFAAWISWCKMECTFPVQTNHHLHDGKWMVWITRIMLDLRDAKAAKGLWPVAWSNHVCSILKWRRFFNFITHSNTRNSFAFWKCGGAIGASWEQGNAFT